MTPAATPPTLQGLRLRENHLFFALTVLVGVLAGLSAVLFSLAIDRASRTLFGFDPSNLRLFLVPTCASLLAGVLLAKVFPDVRGSGVPQTKAAFHLRGGVIPLRVPLGKFLMGVLCVGSGHSMGREGPSVQIGAGLASAIGRWVGLPPHRVRELVPVGAAGALAAAFNTPVAAVIFALEELIGDMNAPLIGSTVVASVAAVMVERSILGNEPLFHVPTYQLVHPAELAAYAVLGVVGGILSLIFCRTLLRVRARTLDLSPRAQMLLPAVGGTALGVFIIFVPEVMGVGYDYIGQALNGGLVLKTLLLLCAAKLVATLISYTTGNAGGIFAPSLYIGAMAGGAVGILTHMVAPFPTADVGAYALVGMGALFAGIIRAPMTSVFMIFEITQDYQILVPLMVANLLSFMISRHYQPVPIYHALLEQDGVHLPATVPSELADAWTAGDAMQREVFLLSPRATVSEAARSTQARTERAFLVGSADHVVGVVIAADLHAAVAHGTGSHAIAGLVRPVPQSLSDDDPHDTVLDRLSEAHGPVPVVSGDTRRVLGMIDSVDVVRHLAERASSPR
ncbi:MAG TPA: chloride channel protein [Vicinamibacterales bacterium]|nr:chloride channel protein [Vicinamibacterales bacterium]